MVAADPEEEGAKATTMILEQAGRSESHGELLGTPSEAPQRVREVMEEERVSRPTGGNDAGHNEADANSSDGAFLHPMITREYLPEASLQVERMDVAHPPTTAPPRRR